MMTDQEFKEQQARVKKVVDEMKEQLGFSLWRFTHNYFRQSRPIGPGAFGTTQAITYPNWEYMSAEFDWYLPEIAQENDRTLRYVVAHELSHIWLSMILDGMPDGSAKKLVELAATQIGMAILSSEELAVMRDRNLGKCFGSGEKVGA